MDTQIHRERWRLLHQVVRLPEVPMMILGFVWVVLLSIDMARGLQGRLAIVSEVIWIIFGLDFLLEFLIAPKKIVYLKRHWPVALSLAVPAFRIVRFVRVVHLTRAAAAAPAAHTLASMNRALAALGATLRRRGFAYVSLLTILAMVIGAAAIENFERGGGNASGIHDYGTALWWTAMLMTTLGPTSWPVTVAGGFCASSSSSTRSRCSAT